jgi:hypothetical protein
VSLDARDVAGPLELIQAALLSSVSKVAHLPSETGSTRENVSFL